MLDQRTPNAKDYPIMQSSLPSASMGNLDGFISCKDFFFLFFWEGELACINEEKMVSIIFNTLDFMKKNCATRVMNYHHFLGQL